jgi:hypothetical protein
VFSPRNEPTNQHMRYMCSPPRPNSCHPEAVETPAPAGDSQRRIYARIAEHIGQIWADGDKRGLAGWPIP